VLGLQHSFFGGKGGGTIQPIRMGKGYSWRSYLMESEWGEWKQGEAKKDASQTNLRCGVSRSWWLNVEAGRMCHVGALVILSSRHLKNCKCRERLSLNSPYLPKDRSPWRNWTVKNPLPEHLVSQERWTLLTEETRCQYHAQTDHVTNDYFSHLLRAHSSFQDIIFSRLRGLDLSPLLFPY